MSDSDIGDEWDEDVLKRKKYSLFLTKYLEDKGENCVININAPWGFGKTFFLDKWFKDIGGKHPAVFFNAWKNDYSNDPLVSIISCINKDIIPLLPKNANKIHTAKTFCSNSVKLLKKLAPIITIGALGKAIGSEAASAVIEATNEDEKSITEISGKLVEELLSSHESISSSIDDFKDSVTSLITEVTKNKNLTPPLFVFIDELDRCRPLYSIELLERIKHIFDIPKVVFVIATDTQQLSHSVKSIYGEGFNAEIYLRRFFDQTYTLPEPNCIEFTTLLFKSFTPKAKYFVYGISNIPFIGNKSTEKRLMLTCKPQDQEEIILIFSLFSKFFKLDLRTNKQCFERFVAIERTLSQTEELHFGYLIFLIMLDAKSSTDFQEYFNGLSPSEGKTFLNKFGTTKDNLKIKYVENHNEPHITARDIIEKYNSFLSCTKDQLREYINQSNYSDFEMNLITSIRNNYEYLVKYKERVEMAEALD